jgi:lysophospholipase L1-like esterase
MNKENINYEYKKLCPFKWFVLENFPFIEADFDALTNWQLFCKLGQEMNKIINSVNSSGEQVEILTEAFNNLQNYVNNYFDNLDIQEEVNNKLNEMAQSGELAELISQYLESQAVIGFNTTSALSQATNLANGSIARTLGRNQYNDGYGAFYKIRQRTNSDTPDGYNIIVLTNTENLVAERILKEPTKKYIFVGDSYLQGYTPSGEVENWGKKLANMLGLEDNQWKRVARGGTAMNITNTNNFYNLISEQTGDSNVTDVILCAGYNDHQDIGTEQSILSGMQQFKNKVSELYPNAVLKIGFIGNTSIVQDKYGVSSKCPLYIKSCSKLNIDYLNNVEYALHNYNTEFATDGIHPNNLGEQVIAEAIYQAIKTGTAHIYRPRTPVKQAGSSFYIEQENNILKFISNDYYSGNFSEPKTINMTGGNHILMYEQFDNSLAISCGSSYLSNSTTIPVFFVTTDNKTILVNCKVTLDNRFLVLYPFALNDAGTNYLNVTIKGFQIRPFTFLMDALYN